jgi:hypothetical protein
MFSLEQVIEGKIAVLIETLNMSVGELVNMYSSKPQELIIHPKYPRSFWWSNEQRSRLIQSIFLGLPLEITTIEDSSKILELIDGKQRLYSMIQFVDASILDLQPLILQGCDLVPELNGNSFNDLPLSMRLNFKRSPIKTAILSINNRGLSMAYTSKLRFSIIKSLTSSEF